jgi:hypothetical protein
MQSCGSKCCGVWAIALLLAAVGPVFAQQTEKPAAPAGTGPQLAEFKAAGKAASLTILPARLGGSLSKPVGEVVGMLLERGGMKNLELGAAEFRPPDQADLAQTGQTLGEFARANPPQTDYVLFADFLGSPGKGVDEVRGVIVNKQGAVVWQDRQTPDDADFKRIKPREPMDCCVLLAERLRPVLGLDDPTRGDAPEGKLARRWQEKTGLPDEAEEAALKERQQAFKKAAASATLLVYPAHAGTEVSKESATHVAELINEAKLMKATAADEGPQLEIKGNMNEQKMLWDMARAFREYVQKQPPSADYVVYADYLMGKDAVGGVHFAVCDRQGQWVIVDFQNDHQDDFRAIKPKSRADCDRLVVKRLEGYCR